MQIETRSTEQLARYLDLATTEVKLTAQNMANIDTPGYRALGMDFEGEMHAAMTSIEQGRGTGGAVRVLPEDGLVTRADGNNVSMERESLNLAEAQLRFRTGVALLRNQYQMIMDAIKSDGK